MRIIRTVFVAALTSLTFAGSVSAETAVTAEGPAAATKTETATEALPKTFTAHGLSLIGPLKYGPDFKHFNYVNPNAPKGGHARVSAIGTFDNLNALIPKGTPVAGTTSIGTSLSTETLMDQSLEEPSTSYGLIAESVEYPEDFSWAIFRLRKEAQWHDGKPITAEDIKFSFETLVAEGRPHFRFYFQNVSSVDVIDTHTVRFNFDTTGNRELPTIMGDLPVLPKHYWTGTDKDGNPRDFTKTTLDPPLGSGPYRISKFEPGRSVTYERVKDYWGADLPVNVGHYNFDSITYEYFRDAEVALQGFLADTYDYRAENSSKNWATRYDIEPVKTGKIWKGTFRTYNAEPMQAFVLNLRRDKFKDPRVREALSLAFDFEWANKNLFYGQYERVESYFANTELAATGLPVDAELSLLTPFKDQLPPSLFTTPFSAPKTDGTGNSRGNLRKAKKLLEEAGWTIQNNALTNSAGEKFTIEFIEDSPTFERVFLFYKENLEKLGIDVSIRIVDDTQMTERQRNFEFDAIIAGWRQSQSPGNEQRDYWGSISADKPQTRNYGGIQNPVVDALIDKIIFAPDRAALIAASKALDRVLLWNHYVVPQWYAPYERVAYWDRFGHPETMPRLTVGFPNVWWWDEEKAKNNPRKK